MNQRIKELALECYSPYSNFDHERFAELIVKECAEIADKGWAAPGIQIKQHFGVEEPKGWICPKCNADRTKIACPLGVGATVDGRCPMTVEAQ